MNNTTKIALALLAGGVAYYLFFYKKGTAPMATAATAPAHTAMAAPSTKTDLSQADTTPSVLTKEADVSSSFTAGSALSIPSFVSEHADINPY